MDAERSQISQTLVYLVLLPGLDGTGILFQPLIAALPANIKPITVAYPPDQRLTYAELLPIVLAALPGTEPFILLGESFSGPLAVMAAATRPVNLRGLILCATFVTRPIPWLAWLVPIASRSISFQLFPAAQKAKAIVGRYSSPDLQALFAKVHALAGPAVMAFRVRQVFQIDAREPLRACELPILYIAAERDRVVPASNLRMILRIEPQMKVVTIAGPHGIPQTRPAEAADAIANFIRSLEPSVDCAST